MLPGKLVSSRIINAEVTSWAKLLLEVILAPGYFWHLNYAYDHVVKVCLVLWNLEMFTFPGMRELAFSDIPFCIFLSRC